MLEALKLDCDRERERIVRFIRAQLQEAGLGKLVVGVSGGVDSSLTATLCAEAVGPENVLAMIMPYATSSPESEAHARLLIEQLGVPFERFEITAMVEPFLERYPDIDRRRKGNIMARCRMIVLYDQAAIDQLKACKAAVDPYFLFKFLF